MNGDYKIIYKIVVRMLVLSGLSIFLDSCSTYNFSQPQPVDKKNIYKFPRKFRGTWITPPELTGSDSTSGQSENKEYRWIVKKRSFGLAQYAQPKISVNDLKSIVYDSFQKPMDTIFHYVVRGENIYQVDDNHLLQEAHSYRLQNDTLTIFENDTSYVDLGRSAFLRKLNKDFYVLNMRYNLVDEGSMGWYLVILKKEHGGGLKTLQCYNKTTTLPSMFYTANNGGVYYFDSKWTSAEMLQLIKDGYFEASETAVKQKRNNK